MASEGGANTGVDTALAGDAFTHDDQVQESVSAEVLKKGTDGLPCMGFNPKKNKNRQSDSHTAAAVTPTSMYSL